ncbi:MAG: isoaspartyl peptidase/L-asparaginase [Promethearchaeota archaeon]
MIIHGGAWGIPDHLLVKNLEGIELAVKEGWEILDNGGSSLDAVEASVNAMELDPIFDAGVGSVLTEDGKVEMDALIMDGETLNAGAVAGLRDIKNPVSLARHVMEDTPHVFVIGEGADRLASEFNFLRVTQEELVTEETRKELEEFLASNKEFGKNFGHETVGAVAIDSHGNLAAATSTGGITGKRTGRVGDVPLIGSGGYADNSVGGASSTGHGESIMKIMLSRLVLSYLEAGLPVMNAAQKAVITMKNRLDGNGGVIVIDIKGNIGYAFNTKHMVWAYIKDGRLVSGI